jgi:hypothetical protein
VTPEKMVQISETDRALFLNQIRDARRKGHDAFLESTFWLLSQDWRKRSEKRKKDAEIYGRRNLLDETIEVLLSNHHLPEAIIEQMNPTVRTVYQKCRR